MHILSDLGPTSITYSHLPINRELLSTSKGTARDYADGIETLFTKQLDGGEAENLSFTLYTTYFTQGFGFQGLVPVCMAHAVHCAPLMQSPCPSSQKPYHFTQTWLGTIGAFTLVIADALRSKSCNVTPFGFPTDMMKRECCKFQSWLQASQVRFCHGSYLPVEWLDRDNVNLKQFVAEAAFQFRFRSTLKMRICLPGRSSVQNDFLIGLTRDFLQLEVFSQDLLTFEITLLVAPKHVGQWIRWLRRAGCSEKLVRVKVDKAKANATSDHGSRSSTDIDSDALSDEDDLTFQEEDHDADTDL